MTTKPTICAECKHMTTRTNGLLGNPMDLCLAGWMNYVTGKRHPEYPGCAGKNEHGNCPDFEAKEEPS